MIEALFDGKPIEGENLRAFCRALNESCKEFDFTKDPTGDSFRTFTLSLGAYVGMSTPPVPGVPMASEITAGTAYTTATLILALVAKGRLTLREVKTDELGSLADIMDEAERIIKEARQ